MAETGGMYTTGDLLSVVDLTELSAGTNLLVLGADEPAMHEFGMELAAVGPDGEGVLVISGTHGPDEIVAEFQNATGGDDQLSRLTILDCTGADDEASELPPEQVMQVKSMGSLTEIGMAFVQYEDEQGLASDGTRVLIDSISEIADHLDEERVFEFVNAFIGRIQTSQHLGIWLMDTSAHSEQTIATFMEPFDLVLEVSGTGGDRELRLRDPSDG